MQTSGMAAAIFFITASAAAAQSYRAHPGYSAYGAEAGGAGRGSSVAYDQPLYYVQRLGPSRYYPPSRYGYTEVSGGVAAPTRAIRTGR